MARIPFSAEEKTLIRQCAQSVWQTIAYDIFVSIYEQGRDTISRQEVLELVLDCDRVILAVHQHKPELATRLRHADPHQVERIIADAFPDKEYA